ncbi:MAG: DUF2752 domain-containing protein [Clostridiales bacterium]|nr:DUF2752 domain-containing protein [Clostridiales bacterium]
MIMYNMIMKSNVVKTYKIISIVVLGLCIYGFLLPVISPIMSKMLPQLWTCPFLRITGHECPFCGITRGVTDLYTLNFDGASIISMITFMAILIESAFRTMVLLTVSVLKEKTIFKMIAIDVVFHTILVVLIAIYVIMFLVNNF